MNRRPRKTTCPLRLLLASATLLLASGWPGAGSARAGEPVGESERAPRVAPGSGGVPGMEVNVRVLDPGLLPAATELEDRLLYHLRHLRKLVDPVLAGPAPGRSVPIAFRLDVRLDPVTTFRTRVFTARPPFSRVVEGEALFASQVPLRAEITVYEAGSRRVVAETVLFAQSTDRTITAGTTKPAADLMAERVVHYLKTQRRAGGFLHPR